MNIQRTARETYTVLPAESRRLSALLPDPGKTITTLKIKRIARGENVAAKLIHMLAEKKGLNIVAAAPTARAAAEAVFTKPANVQAESTPEPASAVDDPLETEMDRLAALFDQERAKLHRQFDAERVELIRQVEKERAEADALRQQAESLTVRARDAIKQTVALRKATRDDRESLELVRSELSACSRKQKALSEELRLVYEEATFHATANRILLKIIDQYENRLSA